MSSPVPSRSGIPHSQPVPVDSFVLTSTEPGLDLEAFRAREHRWIPAVVPGGVHESLLLAGEIEHPYSGRNEGTLGWIEERDWWFRSVFAVPADALREDRLQLVLTGLDTVAEVWLNGLLLGRHENMFRPAVFDVTTSATAQNELLVRFSPPLEGLLPAPGAVELVKRLVTTVQQLRGDQDDADPVPADQAGADPAPAEPPTGSEHTGGLSPVLAQASWRRKAAFSWGWDFGPRIPSIGIWRPVDLVSTRRACITGHHVHAVEVDAATRTATVSVLIEVDALAEDAQFRAEVRLTSPSGRRAHITLPVVDGAARGTVSLTEAELWWTHDLGEPALYDTEIDLVEGDRVLDSRHDRIGLRTIALDRSDDPDGGRFFRFVLNGVPLFARGAAWLPASTMVGSVGADRYRELVGLARDANMTMLRVWGGGIYEHDEFYRTTDELGVLVWQDFMFACVDYPSENEALQSEVRQEAEYQVRRLRNRASMALWAGNNEVQLIHGYAYQNYDPGDWGWDFFHRILPEAVQALDGSVPYWPGSPWGQDTPEGFMAVNGVLDGDRHAWEVWHGFDVGAGGGEFASVGESRHYRRYANDTGRFISEFGIHAAPALSTLEHWIPADELTVHSRAFDAHNKDEPKDKGDALLEIITGLPTTVPEYVDATMAAQAEGLRFGIEHYRRRQPHCSGALIWQFNDVWPALSWSIVDYDMVPKAGYYAAKRAFSPVLASFAFADGELSLWISNSTATEVRTTASVVLGALDGTGQRIETIPIVLPAGGSRAVWTRALEESEQGAHRYAWVRSADRVFPENRLFFAEIKDLALAEPGLLHRSERTGMHSATVTISADRFAYAVRVSGAPPSARFSDNYVDVPAGESREVVVTDLPEGFDPADLVVAAYAGPGHPRPIPPRPSRSENARGGRS